MTTTPERPVAARTGPAPPRAPDPLDLWCRRHLGAGLDRTLWHGGNLSAVRAVRLGDGRVVVLKTRPDPGDRLPGVTAVQRHLARAGFPCPAPLAGPAPLPGGRGPVVTAETHVPGGTVPASGPDATARAAADLARLHRLAPAPAAIPSLGTPPPWSWPDPRRLWPAPDDRDVDLGEHPGPAWLDELAARVRAFLLGGAGPRVVGHADFEAQNLRVGPGGHLLVVHDWDSAAALPEAVLVGLAAAVHTADGSPGTEAGVAATAAFLTAYTGHRPLDGGHVRLAWAAGLWVRAFNARKDHHDDPRSPSLARLRDEAPERLRRAGL